MRNKSNVRKNTVPLICGHCESTQVKVFRNAERVLIRCESCKRRLFAYYSDPDRWQPDDTPIEAGDELFLRQIERDLLDTLKQPTQTLYGYLCRHITERGYPPSRREMQRAMGWKSPNAVGHHLDQLEAAGLIECDYAAARGIRLVHAA